jgi:hypothetical protein
MTLKDIAKAVLKFAAPTALVLYGVVWTWFKMAAIATGNIS